MAHQIREAFAGGSFYQLRVFRTIFGKRSVALDENANGLRRTGKLFKGIRVFAIRILSQQKLDILPPLGADAFRIPMRSG